MKYINTILNYLLDKYERSKIFVENNEINRKISVKITKIFSKYEDEAEYQLFTEVNSAVRTLKSKNFIKVSEKNN